METELGQVHLSEPRVFAREHEQNLQQREHELEKKYEPEEAAQERPTKIKKCKTKKINKNTEQKRQENERQNEMEDEEWTEEKVEEGAGGEGEGAEKGMSGEGGEVQEKWQDDMRKEEMGDGEWERKEEEEFGRKTEELEDEEIKLEEKSSEYTTCSESEDQGPHWDIEEEDELGFLLLSDPGIYEALILREDEKEFSPDGMEVYLEMCKDFGITLIKPVLKQLFTDTVDLKFYGASAKNIRSLAQALKYNPNVQTLDLTETQMDEAAVYEIAELIRENITLKTIILKKCKIGPDGAKYLGDTLDLSVTLQNLDLSANELGDEGTEILAPAIGRNTSLKRIDLSHNRIGQKGAKALGTALKDNQTLSEIKLRWNNLFQDVDKGLKVLLSALSRPEIPLERLDLAWNALGETSAPYVRSLMVKAPQLREICVDHNRIPDAGALTLKRGLSKAPALEIFAIGFNPMTSDAAYALLSAVQPQLKILDMSGICVKKNFLALKTKKLKQLDVEIIHGEPLSAYVIQPVDMAELMLKRARFEGLQPKKKKKKRDFGHLLLEFDIDNIRTLDPDDFIRRLRAKKMKIREELVRGITAIFQNKWGHVNVEHMLYRYMDLFPDTQLPPPKPKKEKKGKGKKGKKDKTKKMAAFRPLSHCAPV